MKLLQVIPQASDIFIQVVCRFVISIRFYMPTDKDIQIFANRGANGIDGVISTAFGYSAGNGRHTYLLIGDLAFLHDSNAFISNALSNM